MSQSQWPKQSPTKPFADASFASRLAEEAKVVKAKQASESPKNHAELAKRKVNSWLTDIRQACEIAASQGKMACEWASEDYVGCSRKTSQKLLHDLAGGLASLGFVRVEWWHGLALGWLDDPGSCIPSEGYWPPFCRTQPVPVEKRRFSSWGLAVRLRLTWSQEEPKTTTLE